MAITDEQVRNEIRNLLDYLLRSEIALLTNPVERYGPRLTWPRREGLVLRTELNSVELYQQLVNGGQYSAVLADGALLQMSYDFGEDGVVGHRLAYIECPYRVDPGLLATAPISDVIDLYAQVDAVKGLRLGSVRFDFDPARAGPDHSDCHLTIISRDCRIPCQGPVRLGRFVRFVFRNMYPELWAAHPYFSRMHVADLTVQSITPEQARDLHVAWVSG